MADLENGGEPAVDVDAMTDEEFAEFKGKMDSGEPAEVEQAAPTTEEAPPPAVEANEADDDEDDAPPKSETVSFARFNRTNERRKAAEKDRDEARERSIRAEERLAAILESQRAAQPADPKPEPANSDVPGDDDVVALLHWTKKELLARREREEQQSKQSEEEARRHNEWSQVYNSVNRDYEAKVKADPTIAEAHTALRKSIGEEMLAMGYTEQQVVQEIAQIENRHIAHVAQNRIDIGQYLKNLARSRGWTEKPVQTAPDPAQEIAVVAQREEARKASISLGKTGGAATDMSKITPQQIVDMTDAEFAAYKEKYGTVMHAFQ